MIVCTLQERQRLLPKKRVETSSTYRGVSYSKTHSKWRAGIEVEGRSINLGMFNSEEEAAEAYNKAARQHFGDVAYQNQTGRKTKKRSGELPRLVVAHHSQRTMVQGGQALKARR